MAANSLPIGLAELSAAQTMLRPYIRRTPLIRSAWLSDLTGGEVYLKLENLQITRSFKARGGIYRLIQHARLHPNDPVLAVSAGNHGQAVALGARLLGLTATVVVPESAPKRKIDAIRQFGAELIIEGRDYDEAELLARERARKSSITFISPYNDRDVICGQGTVALEILDELPAMTSVLVPVGGGGLLAGVGSAIRASDSHTKVIGVQAANSGAMYEAFKAGKIVKITDSPTIADGLSGNLEADSCTFPIAKSTANEVILVTEKEIETAMRECMLREGLVLEGAGAVGVAALMAGRISAAGQTVVALLTGGNVDLEKITKVLSNL